MKAITLHPALTDLFHASYTVDADGCWRWSGPLVGYDPHQYALLNLSIDGAKLRYAAHRYSYTLHTGPIPDALTIDHTCEVKVCVNPAHLEAVTFEENQRRRGERRRQCKYGHPWDAENVRVDSRGIKHCRLCDRYRGRAGLLKISMAQYMEHHADLDHLFTRPEKPPTPPKPEKFRVDWSKPAFCRGCNRPMRHYTAKPDGITVKHATRGFCRTCY